MKPASLRTVLFLWLLGPLLAIWLIGSMAAIGTINHITQVHYDEELLDTALSINIFVHAENDQLAIKLSEVEQHALLFDPFDEEVFSVTTDNGRIIAGAADLPPSPQATSHGTPSYYDAMYRGQPMRWVALTTVRAPADAGVREQRARIVVGETRRKRDAATRDGVIYVVAPQLASAGALAALVWFGIGRGLRPMRELRRRLKERTASDLSPLNLGRAPEEIQDVTQELNRLLDRLTGALKQQSAFIGDAAHQLRTPLAALKASVEYARRRAGGGDVSEHLDSVIDTSDRCIRVVNQLLALAQADAAQSGKVELQPVDVVPLCQDIIGASVGAALAREIDVGLEIRSSQTLVHAEPTLLRESLRNLLDNAIQHASRRGLVTVSVEARPKHVRITVVDDGPGVPAHERNRIFERFLRGEGAKGTGSGLGLPIARLCARAMGGDVVYFDPPDAAGAGFAIDLPSIA